MQFDVLTIFPGMFEPVLGESITGRAIAAGKIGLRIIDIRDFSLDKHKKTDDYPYGGGTGLVMTPQPLYDAWLSAQPKSGEPKPRTIYMSPQGKTLTQKKAVELASEPRLIVVCGHYEGIDERVIELISDEEISIGDYVLTGGEIPAMALIDCVSRLVPGVLPTEEAYRSDSHFEGLLEYPQYTRPPDFLGMRVPSVLLSGNHAEIERWRSGSALERTKSKRPDMLSATLRRLPLLGALNVRDMGGYPAMDGMATRWKVFLRSDMLTDLTSGDKKKLIETGLTTIIDLRSKTESQREPDPFTESDGVSVHSVQILPEHIIEHSILNIPFRELYVKFAELGKKRIVKVFHILATAPGVCIFHCHAGKDRTGIIAALLLSLVGVRRHDIAADYEVSATYFRPKIFGEIDNATGFAKSDHIRSDVSTIEYFLDHITNKYKDAESYLLSAGLPDADILSIKQKFLVPPSAMA